MSDKRLYSYDKSNNKILCNLNDVCDFNISNVFQLLNSLADENEELKKQLKIRTASDKYHQRMLTKWLCKNE